MNEITSLMLLYHMLTFTDWLPSAEHRYLSGWSFCFFICANMAMHLYILLGDQIKKCFTKIKKKLHKKTPREIAAEEKFKREQEREEMIKKREEFILGGRDPAEIQAIRDKRGPTVSHEEANRARAREARMEKEERKRQKLTYNQLILPDNCPQIKEEDEFESEPSWRR